MSTPRLLRYQATAFAHQDLLGGTGRRIWLHRKGMRLGQKTAESLQAMPRREGTSGGAAAKVQCQAARLLGVFSYGSACQVLRRKQQHVQAKEGHHGYYQDGEMASSYPTAAATTTATANGGSETIDR